MNCLGNGLNEAGHYGDAVTVQEADVSMKRRIGAPEYDIISAQSNLANTYQKLGRHEQALIMRPDLYSRTSKLFGEESKEALMEAINYSAALLSVKRYKEAKALLRKMIPVAQRIFGTDDENTLTTRWNYAITLYQDSTATLDDLREAVTTLEAMERFVPRVFGGTHPIAVGIERSLRNAQTVLSAREAGEDVVWVKP